MWSSAFAVATLATLIECVATPQRWGLTDLVAVGFRDLLIAGMVVLLARPGCGAAAPAHVDLITDAANPDPDRGAHTQTPEEWMGIARREIDDIATLADHLYTMMDLAGHEAAVAEDAFVRLDDLRWLLGNYVISGGRVRHLVQLPDLLRSTGETDRSAAGPPYRAVDSVRASAAELVARIRKTNAQTAEWLIAHRVALPDPDYLDSNTLLGRYDRVQIEPMSVSGDPLYLLTCHIHDVLETVEGFGDIDHPVLEVLEAQLSALMTVIEDELTTAQAFNTALVSLAGEARQADAA